MPARPERDPDYRSVISLHCDAGCGFVAAMETTTTKHSWPKGVYPPPERAGEATLEESESSQSTPSCQCLSVRDYTINARNLVTGALKF